MCKTNLSSKGCPNYVCLMWHPDHREYEEILNLFNARSIDFHTEYDDHIITQLSDKGILLHFKKEDPDELPRCTIEAWVNPQRVLDSEVDDIGLMPEDEDSFRMFKDRFNSLMESFQLPKLNKWKLTMLELCVDLRYDSKKTAQEQLHLFGKGIQGKKKEWVYSLDQDSGAGAKKLQQEMDQHSYMLTGRKSRLLVYDKQFLQMELGLLKMGYLELEEYSQLEIKYFQMEMEELYSGGTDLSGNTLRVELRCKKPYLKKLKENFSLKNTSQLLAFLGEYSRDILLQEMRDALPDNTYYGADTARNIIRLSHFNDATKEQLIWLHKQCQHPQSEKELVRKTKMKYGVTTDDVIDRIAWLRDMRLIDSRNVQ